MALILTFVLSWYHIVSVVLGFVCMETLPFLYDRYEKEVDHLADKMIRETRRLYRRFDKQFLNEIPRGSVKEKKRK